MFEALLGAHRGKRFKARSADRDENTDTERLKPVLTSIETALAAAMAEWSGLNGRIDEVLARAAVTHGNESDEYLTRDASDSRHQDAFNDEISNGQRRLSKLAQDIESLKSLRSLLVDRFVEFANQPREAKESLPK